jgi:CRISPR-associated protein Cas6
MPVIDLAFPIVQGSVVPLDHAHHLLGALKAAVPQLSEIRLGVHPLAGDELPATGLLNLDRRAALRLRLDTGHAVIAAPLAGRDLRVGSMLVRLGHPTAEDLAPHAALAARMVVVARTVPRAMRGPHDRVNRVCTGPELLAHLQSRCNPGAQVRIGRWRALRLHGKGPRGNDLRILGAEVDLAGLDPATSLRLQADGLGGRRAFGCGILVPATRPLGLQGALATDASAEPGHG